MIAIFSDQDRLAAARRLFEHAGELLDAPFFIRLWDGSMIPLGREANSDFFIAINGPSVLGSLLRRPAYENALLHYVRGDIAVHGDLLDFMELARKKRSKFKVRNLSKLFLLRQALPLVLTPVGKAAAPRAYQKDEVGRKEAARDNKKYIQFHYDISNEFYALFLGTEMQYSCGYFTHEDNSLDQAQHDKLDMICKKLRLKPDETLLDIGCGWGGLICHAARHYGVKAYGVTLAGKQFEYTREKIKRLGLEDRVTVEIRDYTTIDGTYDKVASIGMFEHVGIANMPAYFAKMNALLKNRGILLNHGISRRAKRTRRATRKIRPERRLLLKYIFPGSEIDDVGHSIQTLERCGFEVHDVEGLRAHYALTTRHWYRALMAKKEEAIQSVGIETFRMWALYLAGVSFGFADGAQNIHQIVATKHASKGPSGLPLTREDLYG